MKTNRLTVLFFVFLVVINFPVLSVFQTEYRIGSIPAKIVLLFLMWGITILLATFLVNRK